MSKIKLYKIGHEEQDIVVTFTPEQWNNLPSDVRLVYKMLDVIHVEYEPEPKILKRQDGSLITIPEKNCKIIHIYQHGGDFKLNICNGELFITSYNDYHELYLLNGFIFLPEDKELAEKKAKMLTKQLEIQHEIDRLNAEQKWDYKTDLHYFHSVPNTERVQICWSCDDDNSVNFMSFETAKIIFEKYSAKEIKQYLGVII